MLVLLYTYRSLYRSLYGSDVVLCILPVAIWKRVISSNILKVETLLLHLAHMTCHTVVCPDGHSAVLGHSQTSGYEFPSTKCSLMSFPVQECKMTKWLRTLPVSLPPFLSITHIYIKVCICLRSWGSLLNDSLRCSQAQSLIRWSIGIAVPTSSYIQIGGISFQAFMS